MDALHFSSAKPEILLVDDDPNFAHLAALILEDHGYKVTVSHSAQTGISLLQSRYFPVIVSDLYLENETGLSLIPYTKQQKRPCFIIFLTGQSSIGTTIRAIHQGAFAYLGKSTNLDEMERELTGVVERALKQVDEIESKAKEIALPRTFARKDLIGKSAAILEVFRLIAKASLARGNVIILGESGTGKELVARAIHENSRCGDRPFITVNCSALTETLLESELFGHVRGSFTGAVTNKRGLFEEANGGTLFLDEIGDISSALQVKLLRAIQEGEIRPVGASENQKVEVRILAATHRHLDQLVAEGKFREDLYYRLKVFQIQIPPLRDRMEDLPDLIDYLLERAAKKDGLPTPSISDEAKELLATYQWPGNIRELENAIERAVGMSNANMLFPEDFPLEITSLKKPREKGLPGKATERDVLVPLEKVEHDHILKVLESVNYNKSKTAEILGIDRGTLYRKAIRYSIPLEETLKTSQTFLPEEPHQDRTFD